MESLFRVAKNRIAAFAADRSGSASTEWVVAVGVVVFIAVPVFAVIGNGSENGSEQIVISIQDTDSFGGAGFHPQDGGELAATGVTADVRPGVNMGVGFPVGEDGVELAAGEEGNQLGEQLAPGATSSRPRFYAVAGGGAARRDKVINAGLDLPSDETGIFVTGISDSLPTPATPRLPSRRVSLGDSCVAAESAMTAESVSYVPTRSAEAIAADREIMVVAASGR